MENSGRINNELSNFKPIVKITRSAIGLDLVHNIFRIKQTWLTLKLQSLETVVLKKEFSSEPLFIKKTCVGEKDSLRISLQFATILILLNNFFETRYYVALHTKAYKY